MRILLLCLLLVACNVESDDEEAARICHSVSDAAYGQCKASVLNRIAGQRHDDENVAAQMLFNRPATSCMNIGGIVTCR